MILLFYILRPWPDKNKIQFKSYQPQAGFGNYIRSPLLTVEILVLRYTEFESEIFVYIRADFVQRPLT